MARPESVTNEDILRWSEVIDNDPFMSQVLAQNPIIREVCYAGQWLVDRLNELSCPDHLIGRMMFTAGKLCFGHPDPWEVHKDIFDRFMAGTLEFEIDPNDSN